VVSLPASAALISAPGAAVTRTPTAATRWSTTWCCPAAWRPGAGRLVHRVRLRRADRDPARRAVSPTTGPGLSAAAADANQNVAETGSWTRRPPPQHRPRPAEDRRRRAGHRLQKLATGPASWPAGLGPALTGAQQLNAGAHQAKDGAEALSGGIGQLRVGQQSLTGGLRQIHSGQQSLTGGLRSIHSGQQDLNRRDQKIHDGQSSLTGGLQTIHTGQRT